MKTRNNKELIQYMPFLLPTLILNLLIVLFPSISTILLSLFEWSGFGKIKFVGIKNFISIFSDNLVISAILHNIIWTIIFLTIPVILGLTVAELLRRTKWEFLQPFYFFPVILPTVVVCFIWGFIYNPVYGLAKYLGIAILGNPSTALYGIAFANIWAWWGFLGAVFYSAVQSISKELYESASLDGASGWQQFRYITLPQIAPTLVFMEIMTIIWSFQVFDWVWLTTQGGPAGSTELLATLLYKKAFSLYKVGEAAAVGVLISMFGFLSVGLYFYLSKRGIEV
jgi:raffinose/stachyose/melibiose transport system permease protein